jgi:hypothetical protein
MAIQISGNTIIDDNQNIISSGIATATNFKTGTTDVHSLGIEVAGINVLGGDTPIGSNATIYDNGNVTVAGNVTASAFLGDGSYLTGLFSGSYTDLSNKPSLFDGNYNSLSNRPSIPTVYNPTVTFRTYGHNANANAFSLNQSHDETITLPQIRYTDLSGKPSIPSVGNGAINFYQNGAHKGGFTVNQSGATNIYLTDTDTNTDTNTTYSAGTGISLSGTQFQLNINGLPAL